MLLATSGGMVAFGKGGVPLPAPSAQVASPSSSHGSRGPAEPPLGALARTYVRARGADAGRVNHLGPSRPQPVAGEAIGRPRTCCLSRAYVRARARTELQSSKQRPVMPSSSRGRSLAGLCVEKATLGYSQHAGGERVGMEKLLAAAFGLQYGSSAERALAATRVASLATERKGG
jgi:hypothetical protein